MIIKTEDKDFARDLASNALINTNVNALEQHKLRKKQFRRMEELEKQFESLRTDLSDIKALLSNHIQNNLSR